jgi:hypothetical protein
LLPTRCCRVCGCLGWSCAHPLGLPRRRSCRGDRAVTALSWRGFTILFLRSSSVRREVALRMARWRRRFWPFLGSPSLLRRGWGCEFLLPSFVREGENNQHPRCRMASSGCRRGRQRRSSGPAVGLVAGGGGFSFLFCVYSEDDRCVFIVHVLSTGVGWATTLPASPMFGVVEQQGRWMCAEAPAAGCGGRVLRRKDVLWRGGRPFLYFLFCSGCVLQSAGGVSVILLFYLFNGFPLRKKNRVVTERRIDTPPIVFATGQEGRSRTATCTSKR